MRRALFTLLSALSFLLCIATGIAAVWSIHHDDLVRIRVSPSPTSTTFDTGTVMISDCIELSAENGYYLFIAKGPCVDRALSSRVEYIDQTGKPPHSVRSEMETLFNVLGPTAGTHKTFPAGYDWQSTTSMNRWVLRVPLWHVFILTAILPLTWEIRRRLRRRPAPRKCKVCGHKLRATQDRCPDCGTVTDEELQE